MNVLRHLFLIAGLSLGLPAPAQQPPPFIIGEWAADCAGDYKIGYRQGSGGGKLIAYTVNKGLASDFGMPTVRAETAEFFTLDFNDGGSPIVWKIDGQTIRPWRQGAGDSIIKDGIREGSPTPTFKRCR